MGLVLWWGHPHGGPGVVGPDGLGGEHARVRSEPPGGEADARDQTPATDRSDDRIEIRNVLEEKRMVTSEREGRLRVFSPLVSKEEYESRSVKDLVEKVFDGTPSALVSRLIDDEGLTPAELKDLQALLRRKLP